MRLTLRLAPTALLLALAACGPRREARTVSMRVAGGPANASVVIDDIFVGRLDVVSARGVALPVGTHRVSIEAPGYFPWDKMIEAKDSAAPVRLDVQLVPIPD